MTRRQAVTVANAAAFAAALAAALSFARRPVIPPRPPAPTPQVRSWRVPLPGGGFGVRDATGTLVAIRPYRRIVSQNSYVDRLLAELCERDRILAFSPYGAKTSRAHLYAGKPTIDGFGPLEAIIAAKPDLVVMNSLGAPTRSLKLRAAGIEVFDLGEVRGVANLTLSAEWLATLLGAPERGVRFAAGIATRMKKVAAPLAGRRRRTAMYLSIFGRQLFGAAADTGFHDVLVAAGLDDVAARRYANWPSYSAEQVLNLDPELIVTKAGVGAQLCAHPGLLRLSACRTGNVVEIPAEIADEPGSGMLDAAEAVFARAYPELAR